MRQSFLVEGGIPLHGSVAVPAAKNSVLPLLAASLLCDQEVQFAGVPCLSDVEIAMALLDTVGYITQRNKNTITVRPATVQTFCLPALLTEQMRASVLFLAPVLSRCGQVETGLSGGCRIGARPIDIHLDGLVKMGARVCWREESFALRAPYGLRAVDYTLRYPSVGATETMLMAAVKAQGVTVLRGVAREPEIVDLAAFLNACGAKISGAGSSVIRVSGVDALGGVRFSPVPDRIVGATIACAVAATGGEVLICQCDPKAFSPVLDALHRAGCTIQAQEQCVRVARGQCLSGIGHLSTGVYPAFPTDAAPLLAAALLCARSQSSIEDAVFENRFSCANGFSAMGANVAVTERALSVGVCRNLRGASVYAPDLRGGAALVIAALSAQGKSEIKDIEYILRGYDNLQKMLESIGGRISKKNI